MDSAGKAYVIRLKDGYQQYKRGRFARTRPDTVFVICISFDLFVSFSITTNSQLTTDGCIG